MKKHSLYYTDFATAEEVEERLRKVFGNNPHIEDLDAIEDTSGDNSHEVSFYTPGELQSKDRGHLIRLTQPDACSFNSEAY
jgi:hypothetical protein